MASEEPPDLGKSPMRVDRVQEEVSEEVVSDAMVSDAMVGIVRDLGKVLKKYEVDISNQDGIHTVKIPDEIIKNSTPLWEDFVVGKFLDLAPHVAKVHMVLNNIWKYGDSTTKVEVYEVNPTTMRFKVSSQRAREKIFRCGMWNIAGVPMIVSKWSPSSEEEKQEEEAIPMWVHVEKVSLHMYSWEGLNFITSTVGVPVKLHPETIACTNLEKHITFTKEGKSFTTAYYYPWLPARCKFCEKWGHSESVCAAKGKERKRKEGTGSPLPNGNSMRKETVRKESGGGSSEGSEQRVKRQEDEAYYCGKSGRLVTSASRIEEVVIPASKYSVLSVDVEEEEGEIVAIGTSSIVKEASENLEELEVSESELQDDDNVMQQVREEVKVGKRRGRKPRDPDENLGKGTRALRRKH
ncbi:uncharacterized protein LOC108820185 [Raphanus sativus]|uniref:Uncharacterized protein LOC108820185 n=1 Tax=Raphanus sativus TaxID=3726 RepID=A0A9W3D058_RAPSA|nr:uncharacterized protein LOC108820185 [Raphanus sativus]